VYGFGTLSGQLAGPAVRFGHVPLGHAVTKTVRLTNVGDTPVKITRVRTRGQFAIPAGPQIGRRIAPGASIRIPITYTPQANGTTSGQYLVTTTDGFTKHTLKGSVTGAGVTPARSAAAFRQPGGGWSPGLSAKID
jgi:hypothetical protein